MQRRDPFSLFPLGVLGGLAVQFPHPSGSDARRKKRLPRQPVTVTGAAIRKERREE
jgi:hypothetical protein